MQLYKEPPGSKGSYILQGEDPHGAGAYPLPGIDEAPLFHRTAAQAEASGGSSPSRWGNSRERIG